MTRNKTKNLKLVSRVSLTRLVSLLLAALLAIGITGLLSLLGTTPALADTSSTPRQDVWVPNGPVFMMVHSGSVTYIGGYFNSLGPNTGRWAP